MPAAARTTRDSEERKEVMEELKTLKTIILNQKNEILQIMTTELQGFRDEMNKNLEIVRTEFQKMMKDKDNEISNLKIEVNTLKVEQMKINERLDEAEATDKRDCLVLSGRGIPQATTGENSPDIVKRLMRDKLHLQTSEDDILTAHRIGKPPANKGPDNRHILVKLAKHATKEEILSACRHHKPNFSANECLTPTRNTIFYVIRKLKKEFPQKVTGCGTRDGKVFVYIKNKVNEDATRHIVNTKVKLRDICTKTLSTNMNNYVKDWPQ